MSERPVNEPPINEADARLAAAQQRMMSSIEALQGYTADLEVQLSENRAAAEQLQDQTERANRRGERGRDWQILQSRIDLEQTSMRAIMGGEDTSPEAESVRKTLRGNIERLNDEFHREAEEDEGAVEPMVEAGQLLDQLQQRVREFQQRLGSL